MVISSESTYRILICHPDPATLQGISQALREAGFFVVFANHARQAVDRMASVAFDLVILGQDVEALGRGGLVHHMRMLNGRVPVAVLGSSRQPDEDSRAEAVEADEPADYFLPYPFTEAEVVCLAREALSNVETEFKRPCQSLQIISGLVVDYKRKQVMADGRAVRLTPLEYNILSFLARHPGTVYSADEIYREVWNQDPMNSNNVVTVHICHIREKIEKEPKNPSYLKVLWGKGYYIDPHVNGAGSLEA